MRRLFLLHGLPGSGKSTLLAQEGLADYVLSSDELRLRLASPQLQADGSLKISQKLGGRVWHLLFDILESRMQEGATTLVDATHLTGASLQPYRKLAERYGYRVQLVSLAEVPFALCMARNSSREELRRVPEAVMLGFQEQLERFVPPEWLEVIPAASLRAALVPPLIDLKHERWQELHVIGDVRGYSAPLIETLKTSESGSRLVVFTGDLFGEGPDNALIFRHVSELMRDGRALVCEGYMERQLRLDLSQRKVRSEVFLETVKPQLQAGDLSMEELLSFRDELRELLYFEMPAWSLVVTHGGLPLPLSKQELGLIAADDFILGAGELETAIDEIFSTKAQAGQWQVHGHRNPSAMPPDAFPQSFNLTRLNGELRSLRIHLASQKWTLHSVPI